MYWQSVVQTLRIRILRDEGQDLVEYGILTALIVVVAIAAVKNFGDTVNTIWEVIAQQ